MPGAPNWFFFGWDTVVAYTKRYPILSVKRSVNLRSLHRGKKSENSECSYLPTVGCKERDPLHQRDQCPHAVDLLEPLCLRIPRLAQLLQLLVIFADALGDGFHFSQ